MDNNPEVPSPDLLALFIERGQDPSQYPGYHSFEIMGREGDTKAIWDKNNPDEVEAARAQFNMLVKQKKFTAFYVVGKEGDKGEQMREFDPKAERIIFVPAMAGG